MNSATNPSRSEEIHSIALTQPKHVRSAAARLYNQCYKQWHADPTAAQARALTGLLSLTLKSIEIADLVPRLKALEAKASGRQKPTDDDGDPPDENGGGGGAGGADSGMEELELEAEEEGGEEELGADERREPNEPAPQGHKRALHAASVCREAPAIPCGAGGANDAGGVAAPSPSPSPSVRCRSACPKTVPDARSIPARKFHPISHLGKNFTRGKHRPSWHDLRCQ